MDRRKFIKGLLWLPFIPIALKEVIAKEPEDIPNTAFVDKITYLGKDDYTIEYWDTYPINDGKWHHYGKVFTKDKVDIYLDGILIKSVIKNG